MPKSILKIRDWIEQRTGIVYPTDEESTLPSRLASFCAQQNLTTSGVWRRLQSGDAGLETRVAEIASTNHTHFFREPEAFEFLRDVIFPSLPRHQELRLWSAAASSGEEAYSIAIRMKQAMLGINFHQVKILGTDISEQQIKLAERGAYPARAISDLGEAERLFFTIRGGSAYVLSEIVAVCLFRRMNLVQFPWPFRHRFHVIFLRNVLYYFSPSLREEVLAACFEVTEPGGWLVTSTTEPLFTLRMPWSQRAPGLYQKDPLR